MEPLIPFNQPLITGNELAYIEKSIRGGHTSSDGPFSKKVSQFLQEIQHSAGVFLTTSCTDALEMGAMLLNLKPGDVAILPSFTFVSTALALTRQGVRLLFADINPQTLGLDISHVAELIDQRVKLIVPVHYAGIACDMNALQNLIKGKSIDLFEDNAQGLFSSYQGKPLGSFGRLSALSFHETKNFVCGEGGALVVNREEDLARAHILYDKGTNRRAFIQGLADKYTWVDQGSSFGMSDILAAYLLAQLEQRHSILERRRVLWEKYYQYLSPSTHALGFELPQIPPDRVQSYHLFYVLLRDSISRDRVLAELRSHHIEAAFHYLPLHTSVGARPHLDRPTSCPVTEEISGRLLRLPFHHALSDEQVQRVAETFLEVLKNAKN